MAEEASLKIKLNDDLKQALRSGDTAKRDTIRMCLAAIKNAEIARNAPATDPDCLGVLAKSVKQHQESIEAFKAGKRPDLVAKEEAELAILQAYMPKQIGRDEIVQVAKQIIAETGAKGPGDKGKVMPKIIAQLKGKADGRDINAVVTELLNQ